VPSSTAKALLTLHFKALSGTGALLGEAAKTLIYLIMQFLITKLVLE
jgi:hypothetical protein